ncbi:hypothetical protein HPB51_013901 [Rhipicephalus microplus]|uniref:Secreted protein n=1 Tax=Rhipicephalus microplus TaxID=6941 RepID=A0A9J6D5X7_RHIMP|nr:hypothetical protein HPB51_013901 [Rhipicephalus microplus]
MEHAYMPLLLVHGLLFTGIELAVCSCRLPKEARIHGAHAHWRSHTANSCGFRETGRGTFAFVQVLVWPVCFVLPSSYSTDGLSPLFILLLLLFLFRWTRHLKLPVYALTYDFVARNAAARYQEPPLRRCLCVRRGTPSRTYIASVSCRRLLLLAFQERSQPVARALRASLAGAHSCYRPARTTSTECCICVIAD